MTTSDSSLSSVPPDGAPWNDGDITPAAPMNPRDADAVEALVACGFDPQAVAPIHRDRAAIVAEEKAAGLCDR